MGLVIREVRDGDCEALAETMREGDRRELEAAELSPLDELRSSVSLSSAAYTAELDGEPVALFGLAPLETILGRRACVWLLTGAGISRVPVSFLKESRAAIARFLSMYPVLENYVDSRYRQSLRWLEACGAAFDGAIEVGPEKVPFLHFVIQKGVGPWA